MELHSCKGCHCISDMRGRKKNREGEREKLQECTRIPNNESHLFITYFNALELTFASAQQNFSMLVIFYIGTPLLPAVNEVL